MTETGTKKETKTGAKVETRIRRAAAVHIIIVILELIALAHDVQAFGISLFEYYTVDSNVLQMLVSAAIVTWLIRRNSCRNGCGKADSKDGRKDDKKSGRVKGGKDEKIPACLSTLHLICAVSLTITFLIALLVLAPQEGFAYYFLQDVAPINHFLGPLLSVLTFLFMEKSEKLPKPAVLAPMAATLLYGGIALILNALRLIDGPYFFLRVHDEAAATILLWFGIIAALCIALAALYMWLHNKIQNRCARQV